MMDTPASRANPRSVTSHLTSIVATLTFVGCLFILPRLGFEQLGVFLGAVFVLVAFQFCVETLIRKTYRSQSSGLVFEPGRIRKHFSATRSLVKLAGLTLTLGLLALIYLLVPEYSKSFYGPFWEILQRIGPFFAAAAIPYFFTIDALMSRPRDGYWHFANLCALRFKHVDREIVKQHVLGWVIKGFYLPLMTPHLWNAIDGFVRWSQELPFIAVVYYVSSLVLCVDLAFVVIGYTFTVRMLDSQIRSANPYLWGWAACIVLYKPFWQTIGPLYFGYNDGMNWYQWFANWPWLVYAWGGLIIVSKTGWAWSNIMFGFRFSNLTNRGIITNGPYRLTKHPSYLFKNVSWWLLSVPFLSKTGPVDAFMHCLALLGVNVLYTIRAVSEEMHLSEDPRYVEYALWMNDHGALRWLGKIAPWLVYNPPKSDEPENGRGGTAADSPAG